MAQEIPNYEQPSRSQYEQFGLEPALGFATQMQLPAPNTVNPCLEPRQFGTMVPLAPAPVSAGSLAPVQGQPEPVESWSVARVVDWLASVELGHLSQSFEEHRITGDIVLELTPSDFEEMGMKAMGDKKRLLRAIAQLRSPAPVHPSPPVASLPPMQAPQVGPQQAAWSQPCWDLAPAPPPPPPPYAQPFASPYAQPPPQHFDQSTYGAPMPRF